MSVKLCRCLLHRSVGCGQLLLLAEGRTGTIPPRPRSLAQTTSHHSALVLCRIFFFIDEKNVCFWLCYFQCYVTRLHSQIILFGSPEDYVLSNVCHCFPCQGLHFTPTAAFLWILFDGSLFDHLCSALEAEEPIHITPSLSHKGTEKWEWRGGPSAVLGGGVLAPQNPEKEL